MSNRKNYKKRIKRKKKNFKIESRLINYYSNKNMKIILVNINQI